MPCFSNFPDGLQHNKHQSEEASLTRTCDEALDSTNRSLANGSEGSKELDSILPANHTNGNLKKKGSTTRMMTKVYNNHLPQNHIKTQFTTKMPTYYNYIWLTRSQVIQKHLRVKFIRTSDVSSEPKLQIELADVDTSISKSKQQAIAASPKTATPPGERAKRPKKMERSKVGGGGGTEAHLALIMMGYVLVFLVCHSPRVMLNIYETANIR